MTPIAPIGAASDLAISAPAGAKEAQRSGPDFADTLLGAMSDATKAEKTADDLATRFAAGDPQVGIHEAVIASEKASIAVRFAITLKNKAIEAYRELLNTPI
jgi:flagellar hook-basal body complex protein FliE